MVRCRRGWSKCGECVAPGLVVRVNRRGVQVRVDWDSNNQGRLGVKVRVGVDRGKNNQGRSGVKVRVGVDRGNNNQGRSGVKVQVKTSYDKARQGKTRQDKIKLD